MSLCLSAPVWFALAGSLCAQPVVSAKAGLISYARGRVYLNDRPLQVSAARFTEVKQNAVVRTGQGRAEVLLGPCAAVRIGEESSFRMLDTRLTAPQVQLLSGSAVVDIANLAKGAAITLRLDPAAVAMARPGTYRFDFSPARLKVFDGRTAVERPAGRIEVGAGRMLAWDAAAPEKFEPRNGDALDLWSRRRNLVLARSQRARPPMPPSIAPNVSDASRSRPGVRGMAGSAPMGRPGAPSTPPTWRESGCKAR